MFYTTILVVTLLFGGVPTSKYFQVEGDCRANAAHLTRYLNSNNIAGKAYCIRTASV